MKKDARCIRVESGSNDPRAALLLSHLQSCRSRSIVLWRLQLSHMSPLRHSSRKHRRTCNGLNLMNLNPGSLHHIILSHFVEKGHAPSSTALAQQFQVPHQEIARVLQQLHDNHGVVLHPHQPEVWIAHPFATGATAFVVRHAKKLWWGNCAWCSLGIAGLLGGDNVTIQTSLGAEGRPITVHIDNGQIRETHLYVHFPIPMMKAWDNVAYTCSTMLLFDSETEIDNWSDRHSIPKGSVQPIQKAYDFAAEWYGRHLDRDWRKWTLEEARALFNAHNLLGPIWQLPVAAGRF